MNMAYLWEGLADILLGHALIVTIVDLFLKTGLQSEIEIGLLLLDLTLGSAERASLAPCPYASPVVL